MRLVADRCHVIAEGAAGCAVAAGGPGSWKDCGHRPGGNIDLQTFASVVGACSPLVDRVSAACLAEANGEGGKQTRRGALTE